MMHTPDLNPQIIQIRAGQSLSLVDFVSEARARHTVDSTYVVEAYGSLSLTLIFGSAYLTEYTVRVRLLGPQSRALIYAVGFFTGDQKITITTVQEHLHPDTVSRVVIKSVLDGNSHFEYRGTIRIAPAAQRSQASQHAMQLMLGDHVRAIAIPSLEVQAHQVQCAHGTATARIDQDAVWYAASRGIHETVAQKLIIESFLAQELAHLESSMKSSVLEYLCARNEE